MRLSSDNDVAGTGAAVGTTVARVSPRPATVDDGSGLDHLELGANIRHIRTAEAGLTIEALATAAGVSISLISQIERGRAEPSLSTLRRIGAALDVPVARFFLGGEEAPGETDRGGRRVVVRRDERKHLRVRESDITWQLLTPDLSRKLEVLMGEVGPGAVTPPADRPLSEHVGEEVIVVLEGTLTCVYAGAEHVLGPGDAISMDPTLPHRVENRGPRTVRMLIALTPPSF